MVSGDAVPNLCCSEAPGARAGEPVANAADPDAAEPPPSTRGGLEKGNAGAAGPVAL